MQGGLAAGRRSRKTCRQPAGRWAKPRGGCMRPCPHNVLPTACIVCTQDPAAVGRAVYRLQRLPQLLPRPAAYLRDLDLLHESSTQVLQHDAVRGSEEGQDVRHKVLLIVVQTLPVLEVAAQVHLLGCRGEGQRSDRQRAAGTSLPAAHSPVLASVLAPYPSRSWPRPSCKTPRCRGTCQVGMMRSRHSKPYLK